MAWEEGTPLSAAAGWSQDLIDKLAGSWITTAEQVAGMGATPDGVRTLAAQLDIQETAANRLIDSARAALPKARAAELEKAVDPSARQGSYERLASELTGQCWRWRHKSAKGLRGYKASPASAPPAPLRAAPSGPWLVSPGACLLRLSV
jgi:hypothetical protein